MKNLLKSLLFAGITLLMCSFAQESKAQLHIETSIGNCGYYAQLLWGPIGTPCSITTSEMVKVFNGDNFYPIPPGMELRGIEVSDAGGGFNHASVAPCFVNDQDVGDCSSGTDNVYWVSPIYIMIY